jgi:uncharacterized protein YbjT (DUF2867 family)
MKKIVIAGASGFIGKALIEELLKDPNHYVVGLSRSDRTSNHPQLLWKKCDLYSLKETRSALEGADCAYYLVHSMMPHAGLAQGEFYDFDLLLADNFARAIREKGVKQIVYLGGLVPPNQENLSWHLRSRLEVEETLKNTPASHVMLRAGLIIGPNGSSFVILKHLVKRLPIMILPSWTKTQMEPIALEDVVRILVKASSDAKLSNKTFDIGGLEKLSYRELILRTAKILNRHPKTILLNLIPLGLSRLWVRLITGAPKALVYPLVLSLKHTMLVDPIRAWPYPQDIQTSLDHALTEALASTGEKKSSLSSGIASRDVRSVQRLPLPLGKNADWVAQEYFDWVPRFVRPLLQVHSEGNFLFLN